MRRSSLGVMIVLGMASAAHAAVSINVPNYSFESPVVNTSVLPVSLSADDWTLSGPGPYVDVGAGPQNPGTGIFPGAKTYFDNADGNQMAYIFSNTGNQFLQTLSATYQPGKLYTLTVGVGNASSPPPATDQLNIMLGYLNGSTFTPLATSVAQNNGTSGLNGTHLIDFSAQTYILGASSPAASQPITIELNTTGAGGGEFDFDNVRLTADVPEPTALGGMAGLVMLLGRRRRARH